MVFDRLSCQEKDQESYGFYGQPCLAKRFFPNSPQNKAKKVTCEVSGSQKQKVLLLSDSAPAPVAQPLANDRPQPDEPAATEDVVFNRTPPRLSNRAENKVSMTKMWREIKVNFWFLVMCLMYSQFHLFMFRKQRQWK